MRRIILFLLTHILYISNGENYLRRDNSLLAPYTGGWATLGSAVIGPNFVRLTSDIKGARGAAYNLYPLFSRDWEIHIAFRVHGGTGVLFGDGFAFWLTNEKISFGKALGGNEKFRGLGIFFDTYSNHNGKHSHDHPYISLMVSNGSKLYDHDLDGTNTQLAGCHIQFRNKPYDTIAAIRYAKGVLMVSTDNHNTGEWDECFKVEGVHLPTGYFLGLSAATGDLTDNHDITYLKTYELDLDYTPEELLVDRSVMEPFVDFAEPVTELRDPVSSSGWSFWRVLLWFLGILCFCVLCYLAYSFYRSGQNQRKRLF